MERRYHYYYAGVLAKGFDCEWLRENFPRSKASRLVKGKSGAMTAWAAVLCDAEVGDEMIRVSAERNSMTNAGVTFHG